MLTSVEIVPYEPLWPLWAVMYASERVLVEKALGPSVVAMHHIGSTAIPSIYAKAIIEMLVAVAGIKAEAWRAWRDG